MSINFNSTRCCYCERRFDDKLIKTKEHIVPKSKGGKNNLYNLIYACYECNNLRSNMDFIEFKNYVKSILENNKSIKLKSYSFNRIDLNKIYNNINL